MAQIVDLRKKEEASVVATPVVAPALSPVIQHPISQENHILSDTGERVPYETARWQAPMAFAHEETPRISYIVAGIIGVGGLAYIIFGQEYVTGLLFILIGIMMVVHLRSEMPVIDMEVTPLAVKMGARKFGHNDIKSFWVHYEPERNIRELSLHLKRWHHPYVKVQLGDQDPVQVRTILLEFIPEEHHEEHLLHTIMRRLGF